MKLLLFGLYVALSLWASAVLPFEVNTHQSLSREAIRLSNVPNKVSDFGLKDLTQTLVVTDTNSMNRWLIFCVPTMATTLANATDLVALGSLCEDAASGTAQPLRFLNHFYDPQHAGQGLDFGGAHVDSLTWGLDPQGTLASQQYSIRRAKEYLLSSLTGADVMERQKSLGLMFRTLGHAMHLVQDLGQPQHTRNDSHGSGSGFEIFVSDLTKASALPYSSYSAVTAGKIEDLWHTPTLTGLADYSSTGFVTASTNFRGIIGVSSVRPDPRYPLPDPTGAVVAARQITDPDLLGPSSASQPLRGEMRFLSTVVSDRYTGTTDRNPMTSTYSLFADDLQHYVGYTQFSLNRLTYREAAKLLVPRAVGYSAGMLNYFFRGSIGVAPPDEGVLAVINHSPGDPAPAGCGAPCGFRKIKLKLRNTTAGESMGAGTLLLIAKYHLNNCYRSDLSGEIGGSAYAGGNCRSAEESIAPSDPLAVSQVKNDFTDPALSFTFGSPIPINAADLRLQVVFQGRLGQESDAIAFSAADIYEPSYLIFGNHNDYINVYNADGSFSRTDPYQSAGRFSLRVDLRFNQSAPSPIATSTQLDPGYYHRLAILTDQEFLPYWIVEQYVGAPADTQEFMLAASENQTGADDQAFNFPEYVQLRRTTLTTWAYESDEDGGAIYWIPGVICVNGANQCVPEDKDIGARGRRYPPFKQATPVPMTINF